MAYVYRHIRLDTNQVFYIGIGNDDNYRRAKTKQSRSEFWHNVVNKTKRVVEIMIDDIDYSEAKKREIALISFYGRKDLGTGCLVNLTDGGDGNLGSVISEITKQKLRQAMLGRRHKPESILKMKARKTSEETKQKKRVSSLNRKHSEETLAKMRGRKHSQEAKDAIGYKNKIRVRTEQEKLNMSIAGKKRAARNKK